jgi:hemerythrin
MKQLVWDQTFEIGVQEIDLQHKEFIKLLRRFNLGFQNEVPLTMQLRILEELIKYAEYHFCSEENIMLITRYPGVGAQQAEHGKLLVALTRKVEGYKRSPGSGEQLADFLYHWFVSHTQVEDRKFAAHLGAASPAPPPSNGAPDSSTLER